MRRRGEKKREGEGDAADAIRATALMGVGLVISVWAGEVESRCCCSGVTEAAAGGFILTVMLACIGEA